MDDLDRKHLFHLVNDCVGIDLTEDCATEHKLSTYQVKTLVEAVYEYAELTTKENAP